jgi:hypothetical protein
MTRGATVVVGGVVAVVVGGVVAVVVGGVAVVVGGVAVVVGEIAVVGMAEVVGVVGVVAVVGMAEVVGVVAVVVEAWAERTVVGGGVAGAGRSHHKERARPTMVSEPRMAPASLRWKLEPA